MSEPAPASFREELERLEAIVRALEQSDVDLDRALTLFEEGVRRLKAARGLLEASELTVNRVVEGSDGTIRTRRLER
jgi:exodeoxyribonuclease VII small subunit